MGAIEYKNLSVEYVSSKIRWVKRVCSTKVLMFFGIKRKLDFVILGGMKCGSTALNAYLCKHPSCKQYWWKEARFFTLKYKNNKQCDYLINYFIPHSCKRNKRDLIFESTPDNIFIAEVPERIYKYNPDMKLILLVRNPVKRAFSEYRMGYNNTQIGEFLLEDPLGEYFLRLKDTENYPFYWFVEEELRKVKDLTAMSLSDPQYPDFVRRGLYSVQLERYYKYFKREQILILEDRELKEDREHTLFRVEEFLGIPHIVWRKEDLKEENVGQCDFSLSEEDKEKLKAIFAPWNEKFFEMIGRRFDW